MNTDGNTYYINQHLAEIGRQEAIEEQEKEEAERRFDIWRESLGDFLMSLRDATWSDSHQWQEAHTAYLKGDMAAFGKQVADIFEKELREALA